MIRFFFVNSSKVDHIYDAHLVADPKCIRLGKRCHLDRGSRCCDGLKCKTLDWGMMARLDGKCVENTGKLM